MKVVRDQTVEICKDRMILKASRTWFLFGVGHVFLAGILFERGIFGLSLASALVAIFHFLIMWQGVKRNASVTIRGAEGTETHIFEIGDEAKIASGRKVWINALRN